MPLTSHCDWPKTVCFHSSGFLDLPVSQTEFQETKTCRRALCPEPLPYTLAVFSPLWKGIWFMRDGKHRERFCLLLPTLFL